jgi:hypothetical protein
MLRVKWAQLCEMAFFDDSERLCMIGIMNRFITPVLPTAVRQIMIVVYTAAADVEETFDIEVSIVTPGGVALVPNHTDGFGVAVSGEYVLLTFRDLPLKEEGVHRFTVSVGEGGPVIVDVPVHLAVAKSQPESNPQQTTAGLVN